MFKRLHNDAMSARDVVAGLDTMGVSMLAWRDESIGMASLSAFAQETRVAVNRRRASRRDSDDSSSDGDGSDGSDSDSDGSDGAGAVAGAGSGSRIRLRRSRRTRSR